MLAFKGLKPVRSPYGISLGRTASHGSDTMLEQMKKVKMKEWQITKHYGLNTAPIQYSPVMLVGRR